MSWFKLHVNIAILLSSMFIRAKDSNTWTIYISVSNGNMTFKISPTLALYIMTCEGDQISIVLRWTVSDVFINSYDFTSERVHIPYIIMNNIYEDYMHWLKVHDGHFLIGFVRIRDPAFTKFFQFFFFFCFFTNGDQFL